MRTLLTALTLAITLTAGTAMACEGSKDSTQTAAAETAPDSTLASVTLNVAGTTCAGCLVPIRTELTALKGVTKIDTPEDDHTTVTVTYTAGSVTTEQLIAAVKKAGFEATVKAGAPKQS